MTEAGPAAKARSASATGSAAVPGAPTGVATTRPDADTAMARERLLGAVMLGVASGAILVPLNSTMLAVALPGIMSEFGLGAQTVTLLVSLYLGTVAIALPVAGTLGDRFGARRVFLVGVLGFGGASMIAALASTFGVLELSRVLQAASGSLVTTSSAAIIRETAPATRRGEAFGFFDLLTSTSAAVGPFIGGVIVGLLGWRAMFYLATPLAVLSAALVFLVARSPRPASTARPRHVDSVGLALLAVAIGAFLVALGAIGDAGEELRIGAAVAVIPLAALFVAVELRQATPAVDPRLLRRRVFAAAIAGVFGATVVLHGSFILVPLLVERLLGGSPATSGLVLLGVFGVAAIVSPIGGRISDRRGRRGVVVIGSLVSAVGLAVLSLPAAITSAAIVGILLAIVGLGNGLTSPRQPAALETVEASHVGMAAGTYYTGRYLGGVVGAGLAGVLLGTTVTAAGVNLGFTILAGVMCAVAIASLGLPGRRVVAPA